MRQVAENKRESWSDRRWLPQVWYETQACCCFFVMAWMVAISCSHIDNMRNWISLSEGVILRRVVLLKWVVRVMQVSPYFFSFTCWTQQQWITSLSAILAGPFCLPRQEHCWRKKKQNAHRFFLFVFYPKKMICALFIFAVLSVIKGFF